MNQTTYSFPQIISRGTYKTNLSSGNKSINECLGILLRTRPGELLGDPAYGCMLIERIFMYQGIIVEALLKEDIIKDIDERCFEYEEKNSFTREENIGILNSLEEKYN